MGLQSALTTSLTGLQAAEAVIDVVGNNVANSGTVGFKESDVLFATQFLQTQSIGSAPTGNTGGTNPRQIGLGVKVAAINPDFTQGTIQISSNPLDVAIQGDGFLIVQGFQGETLYTRNGQLQTNSQNDIVTATGNRVLGYGVTQDFQIDTTEVVPINIPLGNLPVAQETNEAIFTGVLSPAVDIGTVAGEITSQAFGDITVERPDPAGNFDASDIQIVAAPNTNTSTALGSNGAGALAPSTTYQYRLTWYTGAAGTPNESAPSAPISVTLGAADNTIDLATLPTDSSGSGLWAGRRLYRSDDGGISFNHLTDLDLTTPTYTDLAAAAGGPALNDDVLDQQEYSYYVTFFNPGSQIESRPTALVGPFPVTDSSSRIRLDNIPQPSSGGFSQVRVWRNTGASPTDFRLVDTLSAGTFTTYIDAKSDADISGSSNPTLDLLGAKATATTPLVDVVILNGDEYTQPFVEGVLSFAGTKGGRTLAGKELLITATTTVNDLRAFMQQAYGVDTTLPDGLAAISTLNADGQLVFRSNRGVENALGVGLSSFRITPNSTGDTAPITLRFTDTQEANGQGSTTTFTVFDSLGEPLNVRLTTVKEADDGVSATFRWFATSEDNEPINGVNTFLRSGTLIFDRNGNLTSPASGRELVSIAHPAVQPLEFELDFSQVSGLADSDSSGNPVTRLNMTRQDGFPPGVLTSFSITESGLIRGVFSNGAERALGQIRMARFANATGLTQVGSNMYSQGINSGEPIQGNPGEGGIGTLTAGAVELSNSDIGQNLIELILASTQYRGGARVITTTQQLLEELLNLRR